MATGRLLRAQLTSAVATSRGRLLRAQLTTPVTTTARGRLLRAELRVNATVSAPALITGRGFSTVVLTAALLGGETSTAWQWSQIGGGTVTLNGTTSQNVTFTAPAATTEQTYTFRVRAQVDGSWTSYVTVTTKISAHQVWVTHAGDLTPLRKGTRVIPPTPVGNATPGLFFELPNNIRTKDKKVFGHYFGPYPRSTDNKVPTNDSYVNSYLNPNGISTYVANGGLLRDRPIPTQPKGSDWRVQNAKSEIEWAIAAGIDGMWCDLLGLSGSNWDDYIALRDAAVQYYPGFYVLPMVDANGAHKDATASQVANSISQFANRTSSYTMPNGKYLFGSFKAEGKDQAWWQAIIDALKTEKNIDAVFCAVFLNYGAQYANYKAITTIGSYWGSGSDPKVIPQVADNAAVARANGQKWMMPIQPQNIRCGQRLYDEALGTAALRAAWARAIKDNVDYIQFVTWSDFSEGGQVVPSVQSGFVNCDLSAYYMTQWKTGAAPTILRDAIYLSHRNQLLNATPQFTSTAPMTQRALSNRTPEADIVEVLTFLTAPAAMTINVGGNITTYTAPAGEFTKTVPLANGAISANAVRNGASVAYIGSPIGCQSAPPVQDRGYYKFSSLRSTDTYDVPTNLNGTGLTKSALVPASPTP